MPAKKTNTNMVTQPGKLMEAMEAVHEKLSKGNHPLKRKEPAFKDDYFLLLTAMAGADNEIDPREIKFLKYIASSLGIAQIDFFLTLCAKLSASRLETAIRSVKKEAAAPYLILDALILTSSDGPIKEHESQFLGLLADCIEIGYPEVVELIKLASAIISKSPLKLKEYSKGTQPIKPSSIHSLYLKQIVGSDSQISEHIAITKTKSKTKKSVRK